jgi:hypothetical protein
LALDECRHLAPIRAVRTSHPASRLSSTQSAHLFDGSQRVTCVCVCVGLKSTSTTINAPRVHNHCSRRRVDQLFLLAVLFYFVIKSITAGSQALPGQKKDMLPIAFKSC